MSDRNVGNRLLKIRGLKLVWLSKPGGSTTTSGGAEG